MTPAEIIAALSIAKQFSEGLVKMLKAKEDATPEQIEAAESFLAAKHSSYEEALAAAKARLGIT